MTSLGLLAALATAFVYGLGGLMAIGGTLGVGTVVALTAYLGRLYGPITSLSNLQVDIMTTLVSFERVLEVLDLEPMVADAPGARTLPATPRASSSTASPSATRRPPRSLSLRWNRSPRSPMHPVSRSCPTSASPPNPAR